MTLGLTDVFTPPGRFLPVPLVARSMAHARVEFEVNSGLAPAMRAWVTMTALPPARKWVDKSSMLMSRPDLMAVMRVSTIIPTGTLRRRKAISSTKVTLAPAAIARNQTKKKLK